MTHSFTPCAAAALLLALAAPGASAQAEAAAPRLSAHRIVIDATSGRPRAPEHDEVAGAAAAPAAARSGAAAASLRAHPMMEALKGQDAASRFGTPGRRVTANRLAFSVVRRDADGQLVTQCVTGEDAAAHARHSHVGEAGHAQ